MYNKKKYERNKNEKTYSSDCRGGGGTHSLTQPRRLTRSNASCIHFSGAFTLAEVLITLVVIGLIAVLTLPVIITKYKKQYTVTHLKKMYTQFISAVNFAEIEYGNVRDWDLSLPSRELADKYLKNYLKIDNSKTANSVNKTLHYRYWNGKEEDAFSITNGNNTAVITLVDGSFIFIDNWRPKDYSYVLLAFDINGYKGPNMYGKDLFRFLLTKREAKKVIPEPASNEFDDCTNDDNKGIFCAAQIIKDGWQIKYKF